MKNGGMTMNSVEMVKKFSDAFGPSGFEDDVIGVAKELIPQGYEYQIDTLNNLYFEKKLSSSGISVHFDAHADEVGFIVQAIAPNGLIRFLPLGGWDTRNIPSSKVLIKTQEGKYVKGIVCSKPPHFMSKNDKDKPLNFEDLFIDVGATNKVDVEKNYGIRIGDPVAPDVICEFDEDHDLFIGKAFDCRIGCAAVFDTIRNIDTNKNISASLSSQEEVGEDLKILGTKSKRNGDKLSLTKLTPEFLGKTITFKEAEYTLVCKKIYYQDLDLKHIPKEIIEHYYTEEAPHRVFVGEVLEIREK